MQVLSLPTSNADAERIFSQLNQIKTKVRNSQQFPSIKALIYEAEYSRSQEGISKLTLSPSMYNYVTCFFLPHIYLMFIYVYIYIDKNLNFVILAIINIIVYFDNALSCPLHY